MLSTACCNASAAFKPALSRVPSSVPDTTMRVGSLLTVSASPWMFRTSVSFANALNAIQASNSCVLQGFGNARKFDSARAFKFVDGPNSVLVGCSVINDDSERELSRGQIYDFKELSRYKHAGSAYGLQLRPVEHGTGHHVRLSGFRGNSTYSFLNMSPKPAVVDGILRHHIRQRKGFRHRLRVPTVAGGTHVPPARSASLVVAEPRASSWGQLIIL